MIQRSSPKRKDRERKRKYSVKTFQDRQKTDF
jgi:hypothetical protein